LAGSGEVFTSALATVWLFIQSACRLFTANVVAVNNQSQHAPNIQRESLYLKINRLVCFLVGVWNLLNQA
jgi:hypothetical protein